MSATTTSSNDDEVLAAIEAREAAATKGPWRTGGFYMSAGVNDGGEFCEGSVVPKFPPGRCDYCRKKSEPCEVSEERDGRVYHVQWLGNPDSNDNWHRISSAATRTTITGNYDYDCGGVCSTPADAAFIVGARDDVPTLLAMVHHLRVENAVAVATERARCAAVCRLWWQAGPYPESSRIESERCAMEIEGWTDRAKVTT